MTGQRTAWFNCFAGTAGDMTLGALVHAGASADEVAAIVAGLGLDGWALSFERVQRCGIAATKAHVVVHHDHDHDHDDHGHHRPYRVIRDLLDRADLPERVRRRAQASFALLADVEGQMHGIAAEDVEFHEVGSLDAIVDIVGSCAALEVLGVERVVCGPITTGLGTVRAAHGELPVPAPAVVELLARRGAPARGIHHDGELATPTGVALMVALAESFGPLPAMVVQSVGYGAGSADTAGRPNVVQVVVGTAGSGAGEPGQPVTLLEANVDDVTGEVVAHTIGALLAAGAHDAWATPIVMKKGRPAYTVHALCDAAVAPQVSDAMVRETGTLGLRGSVIEALAAGPPPNSPSTSTASPCASSALPGGSRSSSTTPPGRQIGWACPCARCCAVPSRRCPTPRTTDDPARCLRRRRPVDA